MRGEVFVSDDYPLGWLSPDRLLHPLSGRLFANKRGSWLIQNDIWRRPVLRLAKHQKKPPSMTTSRYNTEIGAGSLLVTESRKVAELILKGATDADWQRFINVDNELQKRSPSSTRRQTRLLRNRLEPAPRELLQIVVSGTAEAANQALLAAAIEHSRLLGDFMNQVIREHLRNFEPCLSTGDWRKFLADCEQRESAVGLWAESTKKKLGQVVIRILAEAKYLDSTRTMRITPVSVIHEVRRCLEQHGKHYALDCMTLTS